MHRNSAIKQKIVFFFNDILKENGHFYGLYTHIQRKILNEHVICSRSFIWRTLQTFKSCGKIYKEQKGRQSKIHRNKSIQNYIETCMKNNDEMTAKSIQSGLQRKGHDVSITSINRICRNLGWQLKTTSFCQLIRNVNKPKRLQWVRDNLNDSFENVIWTDETSEWLERHSRKSYRKIGEVKRKPKPKHPLKVHVWAGISKRGKTKVCIFKGAIDADLYIDILRKTLVPYIKETHPNNHRFMQDNDPKHTSKKAKFFFETNNINWWRTPAGKSER